MNQSTTQIDTLITFVRAFLAGELLALPQLHRAECAALALVVHTAAAQRAEILQHIRHVPKYKAFDELLKHHFDSQAATPVTPQASDISPIAVGLQAPDTAQPCPYQLRPLNYYKDRPPKTWAVDEILFDRGLSLFAEPAPNTFHVTMIKARLCIWLTGARMSRSIAWVPTIKWDMRALVSHRDFPLREMYCALRRPCGGAISSRSLPLSGIAPYIFLSPYLTLPYACIRRRNTVSRMPPFS